MVCICIALGLIPRAHCVDFISAVMVQAHAETANIVVYRMTVYTRVVQSRGCFAGALHVSLVGKPCRVEIDMKVFIFEILPQTTQEGI